MTNNSYIIILAFQVAQYLIKQHSASSEEDSPLLNLPLDSLTEYRVPQPLHELNGPPPLVPVSKTIIRASSAIFQGQGFTNSSSFATRAWSIPKLADH